ncbi:hypothetical protein MHH37_16755 [Solibacillus sp. FSL K6-1781]|uniref:hypothetical protein n=1 Tax=Solibacillus sp. FSL K6-1781 TaxID=2921474 RepID=UPI003159DE4C
MKTNEETIWETIKDTFAYIKYLTLSKERKIEVNISLVQEKYWFQELIIINPSILTLIKEDNEIREYFLSRKMVRKLLRDKNERKLFKELLTDRLYF